MRFSFRSKRTYDAWHGGYPPCHFHHSAKGNRWSKADIRVYFGIELRSPDKLLVMDNEEHAATTLDL